MLNKRDMYIDYKRSYKRRGRRRRKLPFILLLLLLAVSIGCGAYYMIRMRIDARNKVTDSKGTVPGEVSEEQIEQGQSTAADTSSLYKQADTGQNMKKPAASATVTPEPTALPVQPAVEAMGTEIPVAAKGIYVTSAAAGSKKLDSLVTIADTTEINALVIDIKDDHGRITYEMDSALAKEIGATTKTIKDMEAFIRKLKERNIYLIARIVAFKDPYLAKNRKDLAIKNKDGSIYRDNNGEGWINPYNRKVWEYLIEVASEAAAVGFDEIQFDYIRFSTGNGIADADFGKEARDKSKEEIIIEFTKYAYESLKPLGVYVSADVYGTIISSSTDAGLVGQNYAEMAKYLDYICPMIYPSHFGEGNYGIKYPDLEPNNIIRKVLTASREKLEALPEDQHRAVVRPWLQDFTATWISNYMEYGGDELREQVNGVYAAGYQEWLLWNAACDYSVEGLLAD
jgi:hypothetical protein